MNTETAMKVINHLASIAGFQVIVIAQEDNVFFLRIIDELFEDYKPSVRDFMLEQLFKEKLSEVLKHYVLFWEAKTKHEIEVTI